MKQRLITNEDILFMNSYLDKQKLMLISLCAFIECLGVFMIVTRRDRPISRNKEEKQEKKRKEEGDSSSDCICKAKGCLHFQLNKIV